MSDLSLPQLPALRRSTLIAGLLRYVLQAFIGLFAVPAVLVAALLAVSCGFSFNGVAQAIVQQVAEAGTGDPAFINDRHCARHDTATRGSAAPPVQCIEWTTTRVPVAEAAKGFARTLRTLWTSFALIGLAGTFVYAPSSPLALRRRIDMWMQTKRPGRFSRKTK